MLIVIRLAMALLLHIHRPFLHIIQMMLPQYITILTSGKLCHARVYYDIPELLICSLYSHTERITAIESVDGS